MVAQIDKLYISTRPSKVYSRIISYLLFEGRPLTTRGRWINPLVATHFALEKRLPQLRQVKQPIFILGTGRSGTTILGTILSMHKDVGFLNEPKALWHSVNPRDDLIGSYSKEVGDYRLGAECVTDELRISAHKLYGAYLACSLSHRVVDKYPEMIFRVPYLKSIFPDSKFLFLVRNGWDTCHSIENWSARLGKQVGTESHDWWGRNRSKWNQLVDQLIPEFNDLAPCADKIREWTDQIDMAALEWILSMREGMKISGRYPQDVFKVRYETLCAEPREVLRQILSFANLDLNDEKPFTYAESVLRPARKRAQLALNPIITTPFEETMMAIGYDV